MFFKTGRFIASIFESKGNHLGERKFLETVFDVRIKKRNKC